MSPAAKKKAPAPTPVFFESQRDLRRWLAANHAKEAELWVGFWKKETGRGVVDYRQALDEALCFGWIDGVRMSRGDGSYMQRFTPRRARSSWSQVNLRRMAELEALGLVTDAGREALERGRDAPPTQYSFEQEQIALDGESERLFRKNKRAWAHWESRPPGYRRTATWWVVSAKKLETRAKRLSTLVECSARGEPIPLLDRRRD